MKLSALLLWCALALGACGDDYGKRPQTDKELIILGIDGMDPALLQKYMDEGRVPNLKALAERGTFMPLATTDPPQSPVAWSAFITGLDLDGHGIYDFVHRDPVHLSSYLSTSRPVPPETLWGIIPWGGGGHELLRGGEAFWQRLEKRNVGATVTKIPANFPPAESKRNESMSGMGTPDLFGTYGVFQVYSDDPAWKDKSVPAGIVHPIDFAGGPVVQSRLDGPDDDLYAPLKIALDRENKSVLVEIGAEKVILRPGEWSDWVPADLGESLTGAALHGMVRLHLRDIEPFHLYVSPINTDPVDSELHIAEPPAWAESMAKQIGRFYTQGMAEDTKALSGGALSDEEFLAQAEIVFDERVDMLRYEMERYQGGLFFFYFGSIDQVGHMYYGSLSEDALPQYKKYDYVVPETYERMDKVVGEVLEWAGDRPVLLMSDHGFAPYTWHVHLNTWLAQQGYLEVLPQDRVQKGELGHIDWANTQAYALGLNQLFLNTEGREAKGVVTEADRELTLQQLERDLKSWRHAETGRRVVTEVIRPPRGALRGSCARLHRGLQPGLPLLGRLGAGPGGQRDHRAQHGPLERRPLHALLPRARSASEQPQARRRGGFAFGHGPHGARVLRCGSPRGHGRQKRFRKVRKRSLSCLENSKSKPPRSWCRASKLWPKTTTSPTATRCSITSSPRDSRSTRRPRERRSKTSSNTWWKSRATPPATNSSST